MTLLAIDTTGPDCAVALRVDGRPDHVLCERIGRGHAERLAPMVQQILADAGVTPGALTRIGVTIGPGSFAGTRVGTAFARGLALATGAVAIGIGNLAVIARQLHDVRPLAVLHDAKRGEVILQVWTGPDASGPQRLTVEAVPAHLDTLGLDGLVLAGSGAALVDPAGASVRDITELDLHALLDLVAEADPAQAPASPFYARPPDAKLPGGVEPV
jgi:tRNA threonylcarbamoyladenosine biosynthesis protein TsaB